MFFSKSLTTTMPNVDGKTEKFELFEDLFETTLKAFKELTEKTKNKINSFQTFVRDDALHALNKISNPTREVLEEFITVSCMKYVKPQSMATTEHKLQELVVNLSNQK